MTNVFQTTVEKEFNQEISRRRWKGIPTMSAIGACSQCRQSKWRIGRRTVYFLRNLMQAMKHLRDAICKSIENNIYMVVKNLKIYKNVCHKIHGKGLYIKRILDEIFQIFIILYL